MKKLFAVVLAGILLTVLVTFAIAYQVGNQKDLGTGLVQIEIKCNDSNNRYIYLNKKYKQYCLTGGYAELGSVDCDYSLDKIAKKKCNE